LNLPARTGIAKIFPEAFYGVKRKERFGGVTSGTPRNDLMDMRKGELA
jgi:hypothetical protein